MKTDSLTSEEQRFCRLADEHWATSVARWGGRDAVSPQPLIAASHRVLARRMAEIGEDLDDYDHPHDAIMQLQSSCAEMAEPELLARAALHARLMVAVILHARTTNLLSGRDRDSACAVFAASALGLFHDAREMDRAVVLGDVVLACSPSLEVTMGDADARGSIESMLRQRMISAADAANDLSDVGAASRFLDAVDRATAQTPGAEPSSRLELVRSKTLALRGLGAEALAAADAAIRLARSEDARVLAAMNLKELRNEILGEPIDHAAMAREALEGIHGAGRSVADLIDTFDRGDVIPGERFHAVADTLHDLVTGLKKAGLDPRTTVLFEAKRALSSGRADAVSALRPALEELALSEGKDGVTAALLLALVDAGATPGRLASAIERASNELGGLEPLSVNRTIGLCFAQIPSSSARGLAWEPMLRFQEHLVRSLEGFSDVATPEQRMERHRVLFPELEISCFNLVYLAEIAAPARNPRLLMLLHRLFSLFSGIGLRVQRTWRSLADPAALDVVRVSLSELSEAIGAENEPEIQRLREHILARLVGTRRVHAPVSRSEGRDDFTFPQIVITRSASFIHTIGSEEIQTLFLVDNFEATPRFIRSRLEEVDLSSLSSLVDLERRRLDEPALARLSSGLLPYSAADLPATFGLRLGGALQAIPWAALTTRDGHRVGEIAAPILLTDELDPRATLAPIGGSPRILALGDPDYGGQPARDQDLPGETLRGARSVRGAPALLPGTRDEVLAIEECFSSTTVALLGSAATRSSLLRALAEGPPDILHVAAHAVSSPAAPERSHVVLAREGGQSISTSLGFDEVSLMDLRGVRLVVLSACSTMRGRSRQAEGVLALSWAFKAAGAGAVISTRWEVADDAAAYLWAVFYARLAEGASLPEALRAGCRELRGDPRFSDPYHWAAYQILV